MMNIITDSYIFNFFYNRFLSYGMLLFLFLSCNKENAFDCVKSSGKTVEQDIALESFKAIILNDDIDLFISTGNKQEVMLKTGENILPKIVFSVVNDTLSISNSNFCNWARKYNNVKVYISAPSLFYIKQLGYGTIRSTNTLVAEQLTVESLVGPGDVDLQVQTQQLSIISNSTSNYKIDGATNGLFVGYFSNDGKFDGKGLVANNVSVIHDGTNTIKISPIDFLSVEIKSYGNVELYHNPDSIASIISGKGKLIVNY